MSLFFPVAFVVAPTTATGRMTMTNRQISSTSSLSVFTRHRRFFSLSTSSASSFIHKQQHPTTLFDCAMSMSIADNDDNNNENNTDITVSQLGEILVRSSMLGDEQQVADVLQQCCNTDMVADVVNYASGQSSSRMTALMWAAAEGHFEIARHLLNAASSSSSTFTSAAVDTSDNISSETVTIVKNEDSDNNNKDNNKSSITTRTTTSTVVDIDARNASGYTALLFAMENVPNLNPFPTPPPGFPGNSSSFLSSSSSSSSSFSFGSSEKSQPLQQPRRTITSGHVSVINLLLDYGADITIRNDLRDTLLHMAVRRAQPGLIRRLLIKGLDINDCSNYARESPLHVAARQGHAQVAQSLCELGAEVNGGNVFDWTPLMWAAASGWEDVVVVLLQHGANVNVRGETGSKTKGEGKRDKVKEYTTALKEARKSSKPESIAKLLIRAGAVE